LSVITKTRGRAAEYAPFAVNLYDTCPHNCQYCYVPSTPAVRARGRTQADFRGVFAQYVLREKRIAGSGATNTGE
jgi:DNA repair photolyase